MHRQADHAAYADLGSGSPRRERESAGLVNMCMCYKAGASERGGEGMGVNMCLSLSVWIHNDAAARISSGFRLVQKVLINFL